VPASGVSAGTRSLLRSYRTFTHGRSMDRSSLRDWQLEVLDLRSVKLRVTEYSIQQERIIVSKIS
jgi:hypothetical protein